MSSDLEQRASEQEKYRANLSAVEGTDDSVCIHCHKIISPVSFEGEGSGWVNQDDRSTCPDPTGEYFPHEPYHD